ncbi:hypothetical protein IFM89_010313 [Coptis chinensis]|uniref:CCHC-type domain-containing protein n=1 Tax=Coptis chinensis TaxID=261450 RepID=A0A835HUS9_9MAGN|nr:hypothetical protein IFM89_010313 [Coptis chinensis]
MYFVICKDKDCKWFVKCSKKINELIVKLRKYNDIHTCEADEENKVMQAKAPWVANELEAFARAHPTFAPVDLFNEIYREYGVHISYWTAWRARIMLLEKMHGHMYKNFKTIFKGHYLESLCWGAAKAYRTTTHEAFMDSIEQADKDAKKWLAKESRKTWARSYFDLTPKTNVVTSNCCESFNSSILKIRDKPFMQFVDKYTLTIMSLMYDRREIGDGLSEGDLVPVVQGIVVITTLWSHSEQLMQAAGYIYPIANKEHWDKIKPKNVVLPPPNERRPRRPKKQRIRGNYEEKVSGKRKCRNCGEVGHNARTCKKAAKETSSSPSRRDLILPSVYNNFSARQAEICRQFINLNPKCSHKMVLDHMVELNWEENHGSKRKEEDLHGGEHKNIPKKVVVQALKAKGFVLPKLK